MACQTADQVEIKRITPVPPCNCACRKTERLIVDYPVGVKELANTQAIAIGAGTGWIVERKLSGFEFTQTVAAMRAGKKGREKMRLPFGMFVIG